MPQREPSANKVLEISMQIAEFANSTYPGFKKARLRITLLDGEIATFPVSASLLVRTYKPTLESPTGAMASAILEALGEIEDGSKPTGDKVAQLAGYPYHGRFRQALSDLVKAGEIKNWKPGYTLVQ